MIKKGVKSRENVTTVFWFLSTTVWPDNQTIGYSSSEKVRRFSDAKKRTNLFRRALDWKQWGLQIYTHVRF